MSLTKTDVENRPSLRDRSPLSLEHESISSGDNGAPLRRKRQRMAIIHEEEEEQSPLLDQNNPNRNYGISLCNLETSRSEFNLGRKDEIHDEAYWNNFFGFEETNLFL